MQVKNSANEISNRASDVTASSAGQRRPADPAAEAGKSKVDFYQTNKWVVGYTGEGGEFTAHKHSIPQSLEKAFIRSAKQDPVTDEYGYDYSKFAIHTYPDFHTPSMKNSRVEITSKAIEVKDPTYSVVAGVKFEDNEFIVKLVHKPKSGVYPFSKEDLLKAITSAKHQLEVDGMPEDSDADSETEAKKG